MKLPAILKAESRERKAEIQSRFSFSVFRFPFFLLPLLCCAAASACSIPVFRYALERWEPAPYELVVFHRGKLSDEHQKLLETVRTTNGDTRVNVALRTVDLDANPAADSIQLWKQQKQTALPSLVLRNPRGSEVDGTIWSGPFDAASLGQVLYSPARTRIAERLLKGDSAVWVLLESGDKSKDDAAAQTLATRVEQLQKTLKLPDIDPDDIAKYKITAAADDLKIAFTVLRVSRQDAAENVLVRMLLASEDDLDDAHEPMAFPIFGRGRALFALVGKGINRETIEEACTFVIGPCSCVVKELNPGHDILITAAWGDIAPPDKTLDEQLQAAGLEPIKPGTLVPIPPGLPAESKAVAVVAADGAAPLRQRGLLIPAAAVGVLLAVAILGAWAFKHKRG